MEEKKQEWEKKNKGNNRLMNPICMWREKANSFEHTQTKGWRREQPLSWGQ